MKPDNRFYLKMYKTCLNSFSHRKLNFTLPFARTTQKQMGISVTEVKLWNALHLNVKNFTAHQLKKLIKLTTITFYIL